MVWRTLEPASILVMMDSLSDVNIIMKIVVNIEIGFSFNTPVPSFFMPDIDSSPEASLSFRL